VTNSFKNVYCILCHSMWHTPHLHMSTCIANTFTQSNPNTVYCCLKAAMWNLVENCAICCSDSSNLQGLFLSNYLFPHPQKNKSHDVRSGLLAGHSVRPRQPSHQPGNFTSTYCKVRGCPVFHKNCVLHDKIKPCPRVGDEATLGSLG
jgi:hypothetical protein